MIGEGGSPNRKSVKVGKRRPNRGERVLQASVLAALALLLAYLSFNLAMNVQRLNLHLGFGFLSRQAGFDIAQTPLPYPPDATYFRAFLIAFVNTAIISAIAIVCSTVLGFCVALARLSSNPLLSGLALASIEAVRNIPLLLQLFFWYFVVLGSLPPPRGSLDLLGVFFLNRRGLSFPAPVAQSSFPLFAAILAGAIAAALASLRHAARRRVETGAPAPALWVCAFLFLCAPIVFAFVVGSPVHWDEPRRGVFNIAGGASLIPEFVAMAIGMSVYGSAFVAEIIRGGIATVSPGQTEAGRALGLSQWFIYTKVVIPQAMRAIAPPLTGQYISLLKNSSLAAAIGYPDLMLIFAGTALNQTSQPLEIMAMTMSSYLFLSLCLSMLGNVANRRMQLVER